MILTPPQHSKSTLTSQLFPAVALSLDPALKLILLSYSATLAESHSLSARDAAQMFGTALTLNPDAQARNDWRTVAGGYLVSAGIRGTVTGRAADGIIIDDPLKGDEEAMSPTIREKIWRNYSSVVETRLAPDGFVVLIGCLAGDTRITMADGSTKVMKDVRAGNHIATYENGRIVPSTVKAWVNQGRPATVLAIRTTNGTVVKGTADHPFLVDVGGDLKWVKLENLKPGDNIVRARVSNGVHGKALPAQSCSSPLPNTFEIGREVVEEIYEVGVEDVFDVEVDRTKTFIANGLVTHNTPWHDEDLRGKLLQSEPADWLVLRFPALCDDVGSDPLGRALDEPLWPARYPLSWYLDKRDTLESRGLIHQWHALYQCSPRGDGTPREFSQYCPVPEYADDLPSASVRLTVLACDPSKSKSDKVGDYAAFTLVTVDTHPTAPHLWVKSWALRTSANEVSATAVQLIEQYRPSAFAIESTMFQSLFRDNILAAVSAKGLPTRIYDYQAPQNVDKKTKIRVMVGHLLQQRRLHLYSRSPATRLFQQMLANFPHEKEHDDLPDALTMGIWLLRALGVQNV